MIRTDLAAALAGVLAFAAACSEPPQTGEVAVDPAREPVLETPSSASPEATPAPTTPSETPAPAEAGAGTGAGAGAEVAAAAFATSPEIRAEDVAYRIRTLADDAFKGRAPSTPEGEAAAQWIADEMARLGIEPAGENGTYFQAVPMVAATLEASSTFSVEGPAGALPMTSPDDIVFWTKRTAGETAFEDAEFVFAGYGAVAPEYDWNDYAGVDMAGKIAVVLVNDPGYATQNPELFNGNAMTYYGRWTYKFEEGGRQGAAGVLVVHETEPASYGWEVVSGSWGGEQYDLERADAGANRAILEGWMHVDAATRLFAAAGLDYAAMKEAAKTKGFKPVPMPGLKADAALSTTIKRSTSRNVAGVIKGSAAPDEFALYTAHWDHLGEKTPAAEGEDVIFNGAVDNASGVAGILEIGEAFASAPTKPDRSILLLAVTLEESGLLGSAFFAENPLVPLAKIAGGVNIDAMLPTPPSKNVVVVGYGASELEEFLSAEAAVDGRVIEPDPNPQAGYFYRSDHVSLAKKGVPMLYGEGGEDLVEGGREAGKILADAYRDNDYHKASDEFAEDWDLRGIIQDLEMLKRVGARIADADARPNWYEGNEFRAIRDASLAEAAAPVPAPKPAE